MLVLALLGMLVLALLEKKTILLVLIADNSSKNWFVLLTPMVGKPGDYKGSCPVNRSSRQPRGLITN